MRGEQSIAKTLHRIKIKKGDPRRLFPRSVSHRFPSTLLKMEQVNIKRSDRCIHFSGGVREREEGNL